MRTLLDGGFPERTENVLVFGNPEAPHNAYDFELLTIYLSLVLTVGQSVRVLFNPACLEFVIGTPLNASRL
jgi:hypothetical protein